MKNQLIPLAAIALTALFSSGRAQTSGQQVETTVSARVLRAAGTSGGRQWAPAEKVQEGEKLYYTLRVRNPDKRALPNLVVTRPVPRATVYVPGSANAPGADAKFSVDGGRTFASVSQLAVSDGSGKTRPATARDITDIQWKFSYPLAPGATALVRFEVIFRGS